MFYDFNYTCLGFNEYQWDDIPRTHKMVIKSFELNNRNYEDTSIYEEYKTLGHVRKIINKYGIMYRPKMRFKPSDFKIKFQMEEEEKEEMFTYG